MQTFTKTEISWMIGELEAKANQLKAYSLAESMASPERFIYITRAEGMTATAAKLRKALDNGDKRIAIKQG